MLHLARSQGKPGFDDFFFLHSHGVESFDSQEPFTKRMCANSEAQS